MLLSVQGRSPGLWVQKAKSSGAGGCQATPCYLLLILHPSQGGDQVCRGFPSFLSSRCLLFLALPSPAAYIKQHAASRGTIASASATQGHRLSLVLPSTGSEKHFLPETALLGSVQEAGGIMPLHLPQPRCPGGEEGLDPAPAAEPLVLEPLWVSLPAAAPELGLRSSKAQPCPSTSPLNGRG